MIARHLLPESMRSLLGDAPVSVLEQGPVGTANRFGDEPASGIWAEPASEALERLSDHELARVGLSRGVLALRFGHDADDPDGSASDAT